MKCVIIKKYTSEVIEVPQQRTYTVLRLKHCIAKELGSTFSRFDSKLLLQSL